MGWEASALVLAAILTAAFLKGITGLGFSTISLGLLASGMDIRVAIGLVLVPSLSSNAIVMVQAGQFRAALRRFWPMYLATLPGLVFGLWLLGTVPEAIARTVLGVVLAVYAGWALWNAAYRLPERAERWLAVPSGLLTGAVNGLTGSQVMPILPFLLSLRLDKDLFVQVLNVSFTLSSLVMLVGLRRMGLLEPGNLGLSIAGIVPVALGIWLGGLVRRRLAEALFRRLVLLLLIGLGANLALGS